jgi:hypothetical protein
LIKRLKGIVFVKGLGVSKIALLKRFIAIVTFQSAYINTPMAVNKELAKHVPRNISEKFEGERRYLLIAVPGSGNAFSSRTVGFGEDRPLTTKTPSNSSSTGDGNFSDLVVL